MQSQWRNQQLWVAVRVHFSISVRRLQTNSSCFQLQYLLMSPTLSMGPRLQQASTGNRRPNPCTKSMSSVNSTNLMLSAATDTPDSSYHINQVPSQGQYHQPPVSPQGEIKPEGSYYAAPHPGMGQQQGSQPQVVVVAQPQQVQQQSQYHTSTPIQSLGEGPAPVDCPSCRVRTLTRTQYVSGNTTM